MVSIQPWYGTSRVQDIVSAYRAASGLSPEAATRSVLDGRSGQDRNHAVVVLAATRLMDGTLSPDARIRRQAISLTKNWFTMDNECGIAGEDMPAAQMVWYGLKGYDVLAA
jgi:hypothetical protein